MKNQSKVYIIDGSAYIYRAYHAIAPLTNSKGLPTHAVYGFVNILRRIIREKQPEYLVVAWDVKGKVFRHSIDPEYKANRPPMPEDLAVQIPYIKKLVEAYNIPSFEAENMEADDVIASAANTLGAKGHRVIVVSGDKDLLQLVTETVTCWEPMNDRIMDKDAVMAKYNVMPDKLLDCFALIGDSSDNVPGVPGIGPKTAEKLINEHQSLEGIYDALDSMKKSKMKERLADNRDAAFLSRRLIRLQYDVSVPDDLAAYAIGKEDGTKLQELYQELEFTRLLKESKPIEPVPTQGFQLVRNEKQLQEVVQILEQAECIVIDTETTSVEARTAKLVGISCCVDLTKAWYIPIGHCDRDGSLLADQLGLDLVVKLLGPVLESQQVNKLGHNIKYDYTVLKQNCSITMQGLLYDTMIAAYLLDPVASSYKLDNLCLEQGLSLTSYDQVMEEYDKNDSFAVVDPTAAANYSCEDVYGTLTLWHNFQPLLADKKLWVLFADCETPIVPILAEMEIAGVRIDGEQLQILADDFAGRLEYLTKDIHQMAGQEFNINSPKQLEKILFDDLQLPHGRKTKTGYSTDVKVLTKLAGKHELPALILQYRTLAKLQSTYVEKLGRLIDPESGRVYGSFNQAVTATGRLSSSKPNLQNIPIRTEDGNRIRKAFVPAEGMVFLAADYSQIDLRVLAHYSKDPALVAAFRNGVDVHTETAGEIFSVSPLLVTTDMRRVAKSINFGIVYGMSSFGLASQLGISRKEAQRFIDRYFYHYSGVQQFMEDIVNKAREDGCVTTMMNRRRDLPDLGLKNKTRREFAERTALNTPIQGTAADIMKLAMIGVDSSLREQGLGAVMVLQIHDEIVLEVPEAEVEKTEEVVRDAMENALPLDVPLVVNIEIGSSLAK